MVAEPRTARAFSEIDRRVYGRKSVSVAVQGQAQEYHAASRFEARLIDLNPAGAALEFEDAPLKTGQSISLEFSSADRSRLIVPAEVMWVKSGDEGRHTCGCEFKPDLPRSVFRQLQALAEIGIA